MYAVLGYGGCALLAMLILPYVLRILNKKVWNNHPKVSALIKTLKKVHRWAGMLLVIVAVLHGYLAWGTWRLHTGSLLYLSVLLTASLGMIFFKKKKRPWLQWHRVSVLFLGGLLALHLIYPSALFYLLK